MRQLPLFQITREEMFQAYYDCRKHKRNTREALVFEMNLEENLLELLDEINSFRYQVGPSSVFVIEDPVVREVFAASFRDRIVHHLLMNLIGPCLEKRFIYDCYACRVGKGTHFGIDRLRRAVAANPEGWVLKMDISSFFMNIDRKLLWKKLERYLKKNLQDPRIDIVFSLLKEIIFSDPTIGCRFLCSTEKWKELPEGKSLFHARKDCGLPIGNLTSQVFANFYMSDLDHYVKHDLKIRWYGRYVDDFFLVHGDKAVLLDALKKITAFVERELRMKVNPRKTYLQRCDKGVRFLGVKIELGHINTTRRTVTNFKRVVYEANGDTRDHRLNKGELHHFRSRINSYLGILSHYNTYRLRASTLERMVPRLRRRMLPDRRCRKVTFV